MKTCRRRATTNTHAEEAAQKSAARKVAALESVPEVAPDKSFSFSSKLRAVASSPVGMRQIVVQYRFNQPHDKSIRVELTLDGKTETRTLQRGESIDVPLINDPVTGRYKAIPRIVADGDHFKIESTVTRSLDGVAQEQEFKTPVVAVRLLRETGDGDAKKQSGSAKTDLQTTRTSFGDESRASTNPQDEKNEKSASESEKDLRKRVHDLGGTMLVRNGKGDAEEVQLKLMSEDALVSDDDLRLFATLKNLTRLEFRADEITSQGIAQIAQMTNLKSLELWDCPLSDDDLGKLTSLKRLEWLGLFSCLNITDHSSKHLLQLPELHSLNLYGTPITASFLQAMQGPRMRFFDLRRTGVTPGDLLHIEGFPQLRHINLPDDVTDADLSHLSGLSELKIVTLQHLNITDAGLSHLKALSRVETLYLNQTHITDDGLANLAAMSNLDTLDLSGTQISTAGLSHLATLPKLQTLDLQGTKIDDTSLKRLSRFPRLQFLDVRDTNTTQAAVAALRESRPKMKVQSSR